MQISQRIWTQWFALYTVIAEDEGVTFKMKNFLDEYQYVHNYAELKPKAVRGKIGTRTYANIAWWVLGVGVVVSFLVQVVSVSWILLPTARVISLSSLVLSLLLFSIRLIKLEMVWFQTKTDRTAFSFRLDQNDRQEVEMMVAYIEERIQQEKTATDK